MPTDPNMLARLLESGAYDRYVQEFLDQQYGRGYVSPYARQRLSKQAPQMVGRLTAESLVNGGPSALADNTSLEQALQTAIMAEMSGNAQRPSKDTGPRLMEMLSQWRNADPMSQEGILAEALLNDPNTLKSLILSSMPRGYGGVFAPAYENAIGRGIEDMAYASPEAGDYVGRVAQLLGGLTQTPVSVTPATRSNVAIPKPAYAGPLPDTAEAITAIQQRERPTGPALPTTESSDLGNITPEELFALRQLVGE